MDSPLIWVEINLKAIAHNVKELRRMTKPDARLMAAVKANAYGHGLVEVSKTILESGADELGVARIGEGVQLREAGINAPILIFGHTPYSLNETLIECDLRPTVFSYETAKALSGIAVSHSRKIKIHLKVDTGMGRLGMLPMDLSLDKSNELINDIIHMSKLPGIDIEGIYTHFATADTLDMSYAKKQFDLFVEILKQLRQLGIDVPVKHAAKSAAIIGMPESHLDMVRPGISVYGLYPSDEVDKSRLSLKPAMEMKARIVQLKEVPVGFKVSYGITYETLKSTTIATVPVGYGDGYNRLLSSRGHMLVKGQRAPIVGRVCMDLTMIDVGHIPGVAVGDEVVMFGNQGGASISIDEIASILDTINYEVVTAVMSRVPRIFLR